MLQAPVESFDPDYFAANGYPHEAWAWMRAHAPVSRHESADRQPFWAVTRYHDIVAIGRDPQRTFASSPGVTILRTDQAAAGATIPMPMLLTMDPPRHAGHRDVVRKQFRLRAMQALDAHIVERCSEIANRVAADRLTQAEGQAVDFVEAVAARLPMDVILELLGVPAGDRDQVSMWSNAVIGPEDPDYGDIGSPRDAFMTARGAILDYFATFVAARRARPADDLVSVLVAARIDGAPLNEAEILGYCFVLMIAGNETTRNATSGSLLALFDHPDAMARLTADPSLMPVAVEEMLRWVSPVVYMARTALRDTEIGGQPITAGDKVVMFYPSANRDEAVFADPFRFDIERKPNPHLAFGFGRHHCLGSDLARIELRAIMSAVLRRFPNIRPAGPISRLRSNFVGGIKALPVDFGEPATA